MKTSGLPRIGFGWLTYPDRVPSSSVPHASSNRSGRFARWPAFAAAVLIGCMMLTSCGDGEGERPSLSSSGESTSVAAPDEGASDSSEAEAPATTESEAPATTEGSGQDGSSDSDIPVAVWVVLGLLVIAGVALLAARIGRGGAAKDTPPSAVPAWRSSARSAYADSRWLYDELDSPLARWRGDALFRADQGDDAQQVDGIRQAAWNQLPARMDSAREALYRVEGAAPEPEVVRLAKSLLDQLPATRSSVDTLAEAHRARRAAEADTSTPREDLERAQARETDAENALATNRHRLEEAMVSLSAMT